MNGILNESPPSGLGFCVFSESRISVKFKKTRNVFAYVVTVISNMTSINNEDVIFAYLEHSNLMYREMRFRAKMALVKGSSVDFAERWMIGFQIPE